MKIAFISCSDYREHSVGYYDEEAHLLDFLANKGLNIERRVWNDPTVDWQQYGLAILKSPWDYHEQIAEFHNWLDTLQTLNVQLLNPIETVRWNSDKSYLKEIANAGFKVIPSMFLDKGSKPDLSLLFEQLLAEKIVIKPCISAGAKNVLTLTCNTVNEQQAMIYDLLLAEDYLAQPFMHEILEGEWSMLFFNGAYSHCILKVPRSGDFRVQQYHGGQLKAVKPEQAHIDSAAGYVKHFAKDTLYARVDGVICNQQFHLMELELIEPYLYLDTDADAYERYYKALVKLMTDSTHTENPVSS
jgi:glutathione synthase/RimK-type ligase-like ATP-grasp enzyme